ncbi:hypothetical protein OEZ86_013788 [Tetradesmus obliquus]|uniref:J domain-containing protein n=1 Tax=Tetradesmus obliquus TaxID=3088 RepID=A0A383W5I1_TETOB|nr:hypothetical protein OEZ86_013788 [Tetradesmus obliquus]|eukprot:jgi/Sobl393_1/17084/SZX72402.1
MQYHPDRHASSGMVEQEAAAARFKVITQAYDILTDERARAAYHTSSSRGGSAAAGYGHPGVNTDWSYSHHTGGSGYTSTMSRWEWYRRLGRAGMRSFGQTLHVGLAVLLLGGGLLFEYSHSAIWQARNKGKTFEDMQSAIRARQQSKLSGSDPSSNSSSSDPSSNSSSSGAAGSTAGTNSSSSSDGSAAGKVWHVRSAWADGMRGRRVELSEDPTSSPAAATPAASDSR